MSQKAYEDVCLRAELFGLPKPDRAEFLEKHKHMDIVEFEEVDIHTVENTAMLNENIQGATGGISELNTILTSTQTKINRLKGVCGSLTNFFRVKLSSRDNMSYSSEPSYVGQTNYDKDYIPPQDDEGSLNCGLGPSEKNKLSQNAGKTKNQNNGDINSALSDLGAMQSNEDTALLSKKTRLNMQGKLKSQLGKLDNILQQTDRAESAIHNQNKEMRSMGKLT